MSNNPSFVVPTTLSSSLKEAVAGAEKFNVSISDLQKMYVTDPEGYKTFLAEAADYRQKIHTLFETINKPNQILETLFKEKLPESSQGKLFNDYDRIEVVNAADGSTLYSIGFTTRVEESVNMDALREVCGLTASATAVAGQALWSKGFARCKYSGSKLVVAVKDLIASGEIMSTTPNGAQVIITKTYEESEFIFPDETNLIVLPPKGGIANK